MKSFCIILTLAEQNSLNKDILGTTTNTLFFAFLGSYLALIIWFTDLSYSFGRIINSKVFASEAISIFCIGISAVLIIPITAIIMAYYLTKKKKALIFIMEVCLLMAEKIDLSSARRRIKSPNIKTKKRALKVILDDKKRKKGIK